MPVDRIIELAYETPGHRATQAEADADPNDDIRVGSYIPGVTITYRVWATQKDIDLTHVNEEGGRRSDRRKDWRIRWHDEIAIIPTQLLTLEDFSSVDADGHSITWNVINMLEVNGRNGETRRRWLDLQAVWSA